MLQVCAAKQICKDEDEVNEFRFGGSTKKKARLSIHLLLVSYLPSLYLVILVSDWSDWLGDRGLHEARQGSAVYMDNVQK